MSETKKNGPEQPIIVLGHPGCVMVPPVLNVLNRSNIPHQYINIHKDDRARQTVREINRGYESVPTLIFPDRTTLTEPSTVQLIEKLKKLGYEPNESIGLFNLAWIGLIGATILFLMLRFLGFL